MFNSNGTETVVQIAETGMSSDYLPHMLTMVMFSFFVERVLSIIYEMKFYVDFHERLKNKGYRSDKPLIATVVSITLAFVYQIDIFIPLSSASVEPWLGHILTGLVIAGGSKASLKLFRDYLDISSRAYKHQRDLNQLPNANSQLNNPNIRNCIR